MLGSATPPCLAAKGYKFFEDQYPTEAPKARAEGYYEDQVPPDREPERYASYEEQMMGGTVKNHDPKPQLTEHEKLVQLHKWGRDKDNVPKVPDNFGWPEEWGPEPGEEGHNDWYNKPREFMSHEEKTKFDIMHTSPVRDKHMRHQELPYHKQAAAAGFNMTQEDPKLYSTTEKGVDAPYSTEQKADAFGGARKSFMDDWLAKDGVAPENLGKKVADYNGTGDLHGVKRVPRRPDWELAPVDE